MKKLNLSIIITLLVNYSFFANAQQEQLNKKFSKNSLFLFNSFEKGIAYFNDGGISKAEFNYDVVDEEICYLDDNQVFIISNLNELDSIKIASKYFCYVDNKIFETLSLGKIPVLLHRKTDIASSQKPSGAYGTSTSTSATVKRTSFYTNLTNLESVHCNFKSDKDIEFLIIEKQYLLINGKLILATKSQINKLFKEHKKEINAFIKETDININNSKDLINLATFLEKFLWDKSLI